MMDYEIQAVPLTMSLWRRRVEQFLEANQLRLDEVDYYAVVTRPDSDEILAGGGLQGDIVKCIAVGEQLRDEHISNRLISHLISEASQRGHQSVKVFTKPQNRQIFESLGFRVVGEAPLAILMENGRGIEKYVELLKNCQLSTVNSQLPTGVIVMNANPFTRGHQYLIEQAAQQVEHLFVIPVKEDKSLFPYIERKAMIEAAIKLIESKSPSLSGEGRGGASITLCEGSDYAISAATFPTYFLKRLDDAADTQMRLDLDIFKRHLAPALGATIRFVGSEPDDALTCHYNELMREMLPEVREIERMQENGEVVSASKVRKALENGDFQRAAALVPPTTIPYLLAHLATDALQQELATTPKPGLIDCHDNGAHSDMNHALMQRSIVALRPYFVKLAVLGFQKELPTVENLKKIGLEAENAMLGATKGVNTHKGALFALGLALVATAHLEKNDKLSLKSLQETIIRLAADFPDTLGTHGSKVVSEHSVKGALAMAREGYEQLFTDWLPLLQSLENDAFAYHKTLLRIMATLDDTNVYHRKGEAAAQQMKADATALLHDFSKKSLDELNQRYNAQGISPGGSADMLALTIFVNFIIHF
ncbi:MAG: [Prevotella sp.]|nr:[citrate (pro-3S)-lyase] ligase [Prevotella sp.]